MSDYYEDNFYDDQSVKVQDWTPGVMDEEGNLWTQDGQLLLRAGKQGRPGAHGGGGGGGGSIGGGGGDPNDPSTWGEHQQPGLVGASQDKGTLGGGGFKPPGGGFKPGGYYGGGGRPGNPPAPGGSGEDMGGGGGGPGGQPGRSISDDEMTARINQLLPGGNVTVGGAGGGFQPGGYYFDFEGFARAKKTIPQNVPYDTWAPQMWSQFTDLGNNFTSSQDFASQVHSLINQIPCPECKTDGLSYVKTNPPENVNSKSAAVGWVKAYHSHVDQVAAKKSGWGDLRNDPWYSTMWSELHETANDFNPATFAPNIHNQIEQIPVENERCYQNSLVFIRDNPPEFVRNRDQALYWMCRFHNHASLDAGNGLVDCEIDPEGYGYVSGHDDYARDFFYGGGGSRGGGGGQQGGGGSHGGRHKKKGGRGGRHGGGGMGPGGGGGRHGGGGGMRPGGGGQGFQPGGFSNQTNSNITQPHHAPHPEGHLHQPESDKKKPKPPGTFPIFPSIRIPPPIEISRRITVA